MRLFKNAFVCFWPATDNKHFFAFLMVKSVYVNTFCNVKLCVFSSFTRLTCWTVRKSGVLSVWEKHCNMGLKNTKCTIIWVPKTHKKQFSVFNKTLLFSVYSKIVGLDPKLHLPAGNLWKPRSSNPTTSEAIL